MKFNCPFIYNIKTALAVQACFGVLMLLCAFLNLRAIAFDEENNLHSEAGRIASRMALLLAEPIYDDDYLNTRQTVLAEMEDSRLAALAVFKGDNIMEGQRRDSNWEAAPWDDLMPEDAVEGLKSIIMEDTEIGRVAVYVSRREVEEKLALAMRREAWRFMAVFAFVAAFQWLLLRKAAPAPEAPMEAHLAEDAPTEESPTDEAPAEATPTEESPTEESPTEEKSLAEEPPMEVGTKKECCSRPEPGIPEYYGDDGDAEEDFFQACQYGPLNLIILAADDNYTALRNLSEKLAVRADKAGYDVLYNYFITLYNATLNNHGAVARLAEESALALSRVLRDLANGR